MDFISRFVSHGNADLFQEELQTALKPMKEKLDVFKRFKLDLDRTADHIKVRITNSSEMDSLHKDLRFLHNDVAKNHKGGGFSHFPIALKSRICLFEE